MSVSFNCHCAERKKPIEQRRWLVTKFRSHRSAFAGYKTTWSQYSTVVCVECRGVGRTKAGYVDQLRHGRLGSSGNWEPIHGWGTAAKSGEVK